MQKITPIYPPRIYRYPGIVHKPVCIPTGIPSTTNTYSFIYPHLSHPSTGMSFHPTQITSPSFEKGLWTNIREEYTAPTYPLISPNNGISDESGKPVSGLPHVFPSNSRHPKSTMRPLPTSGISNADFSNDAHAFELLDAASKFPSVAHAPHPAIGRKKIASRDRPLPYQKLRKEARFSCDHDDCEAKYVQKQGLNRHLLEKHNPNLCEYCGAKWGRPYEYRRHLKRHHPNVNHNMVLGKPSGSRRRNAIFVRRSTTGFASHH